MELIEVTMLRAMLAGASWPPGVADTPANRARWDALAADVAAMRAEGIEPEIPADWAAWPDGSPGPA